jgi:beta-galactosidase
MSTIFRRTGGEPRTVFSLNGLWKLEPGKDAAPPNEFTHTVPVPALVDCATPPYDWPRWRYHWHQTEFGFEGLSPSDEVLLRLDRAQYGTEVRLNAQTIGGSIACYTVQEYSIRPTGDAPDVLTVRLGTKESLPAHSAVGRDQEKDTFLPGIWGDATIIVTGRLRIRHVHVIPDLRTCTAEARIRVENLERFPQSVRIHGKVLQKKNRVDVSDEVIRHAEIGAQVTAEVVLAIPIEGVHPWSPGDPFLYQLETWLESGGVVTDRTMTTFGMREFTIEGGEFRLNGRRIFLRGGNIAFHRFLSDPDRKLLPWNEEWIRRVLVELPKEHNFNFFRIHLGRAYEKWYDLADEYGILLQDEWQFWGTTGSREQILEEFTQWIRDGCNHPSIVIWDPLNESSDEMIQTDIVPVVRRMDPTRPWESVDFVEQHPYIYSLAEVLNFRPVGFAEALPEIEQSSRPSVVNEFLWWWLDSDGAPTAMMDGVVERWLGPHTTREQLDAHQRFLAGELVELFRRMRVDAIQPFVYLSNNRGPTAHWFRGSIEKLEPKPILDSLKNAFAPFGISIELWDRHFFAGDELQIRVFVFNDSDEKQTGTVQVGFADVSRESLAGPYVQRVTVEPSGHAIVPVRLPVPTKTGRWMIRAELREADSSRLVAWSEKPSWCFAAVRATERGARRRAVVFDPSGEVNAFLRRTSVPFALFDRTDLREGDVVLVHLDGFELPAYVRRLDEIATFVGNGGILILQEPEYKTSTTKLVRATSELVFTVERRADRDRGGYDSFVFPDNIGHPLWNAIEADQLAMFNGGVGGEMVSQHDITSPLQLDVLARCGLHLKVVATGQVTCGRGKVVFSRIQVRGRLVPGPSTGGLFDRRPDPVAQQYLLNLLAAFE